MFSIFNVFKKKDTRPSGPPARDPFLAIPHAPKNVQAAVEESGLVQLRSSVPPPKDFIDKLARWCGAERDRFLQLDEVGSQFWAQVDGINSLRDIEETLRASRKVEKEENERDLILFVKGMMVKNWLVLEIPDTDETAAADP